MNKLVSRYLAPKGAAGRAIERRKRAYSKRGRRLARIIRERAKLSLINNGR